MGRKWSKNEDNPKEFGRRNLSKKLRAISAEAATP